MDNDLMMVKVKYGEYLLPALFVVAAMIVVHSDDLPPGTTTFSQKGTEGADGAKGGIDIGSNGEDVIGRDGTDGNGNGADGEKGGRGIFEAYP
jgi:hypothetical protein